MRRYETAGLSLGRDVQRKYQVCATVHKLPPSLRGQSGHRYALPLSHGTLNRESVAVNNHGTTAMHKAAWFQRVHVVSCLPMHI